MAATRLRFQLRRACLNSLGRRSFGEGGESGHDDFDLITMNQTALANDSGLVNSGPALAEE
jgi:hypothetical protein